MSLIGKKLLVNECLESCSSEQLSTLTSLVDNLGTPTLIHLKTLTAANKGVGYVTCWLDEYTVVHGLFIYTDTKCGLFAFQDEFNNMEAIKIDPVSRNYEYVHEHLSATEFRSTLDDVSGGSGGSGGSVSVSSLGFGRKIATISYNDERSQFECDSIDGFKIGVLYGIKMLEYDDNEDKYYLMNFAIGTPDIYVEEYVDKGGGLVRTTNVVVYCSNLAFEMQQVAGNDVITVLIGDAPENSRVEFYEIGSASSQPEPELKDDDNPPR